MKNNKLIHRQEVTSLVRYNSWTPCYATGADAVHLNSISIFKKESTFKTFKYILYFIVRHVMNEHQIQRFAR